MDNRYGFHSAESRFAQARESSTHLLSQYGIIVGVGRTIMPVTGADDNGASYNDQGYERFFHDDPFKFRTNIAGYWLHLLIFLWILFTHYCSDSYSLRDRSDFMKAL